MYAILFWMTYNEMLWKIRRQKLKQTLYYSCLKVLIFILLYFLPLCVNVHCLVGFMTVLGFVFGTLYMWCLLVKPYNLYSSQMNHFSIYRISTSIYSTIGNQVNFARCIQLFKARSTFSANFCVKQLPTLSVNILHQFKLKYFLYQRCFLCLSCLNYVLMSPLISHKHALYIPIAKFLQNVLLKSVIYS